MINTIKATINLDNVCLDEVDLGNGVIYRGDDLATALEIKAPLNANAYVLLACVTPNGRNLGPFNADSTASTSTTTTYSFVLTKANGYNFAVGRTELIVYYCVVNTNSSIAKKAIGSICVDVHKGVSLDDEATFIIGDTTDADAVLTDLSTKMDNLINQVASYSTQLSNKLDKVNNRVTLTNSGVLFTSRVESGTDYSLQIQGATGISNKTDSSTAENTDSKTATATTLTIATKNTSNSTEQQQTANYVTLKATDGTNTKTFAVTPQSVNINGKEVVIADDLTAEATARGNADETLQTNIDNEVLARGNADTILQANIDASGHKLEVLRDSSTYQYTFRLLDNNNNILSSELIDLPIEAMIVNVAYDATNKDLIITLQNGTTLTVPLDDIVSGLASQDWVYNNYVNIANSQVISGSKTFTNTTAWNIEDSSNHKAQISVGADYLTINYYKDSSLDNYVNKTTNATKLYDKSYIENYTNGTDTRREQYANQILDEVEFSGGYSRQKVDNAGVYGLYNVSNSDGYTTTREGIFNYPYTEYEARSTSGGYYVDALTQINYNGYKVYHHDKTSENYGKLIVYKNYVEIKAGNEDDSSNNQTLELSMTNGLTLNGNKIIDTANASTELFMTDAEIETMLEEVFD